MFRWILIVVLAVVNIATGIWGYQEHQEKNAILIQAENNYQRAFHELSYHMDLLHDKIGSSLAMNSRDRLSPQLVEIWRLTSEAHSNVGQLPLALLPFNKTEEFLSNIGDFTYRTAVRDLETTPLSDKEVKTLENLYQQAGQIKDELRKVQHMVLDSNLRWMDVQLALATQDEQADNTIIDGFKTVEKHVEGFSEGNNDSSIIGTATKDHEFKHLTGEKVDEQEVIDRSLNLFNAQNKQDISVTKSGKGAKVPLYSVSYQNGNKNAYMDLTEQGGHPITLLIDRPMKEKQLSLNEGMDKAKEYIKQLKFEDMEVYQSSEYDHTGVYSFLYNEDGIRVYSDAMEVKVALDNGEIIGFTARNYFMNHKDRDIPTPELSDEEAKNKVNHKVDIQEEHMAIIDNDLGEEILVYEFLGILGDETYRIFINAMNGMEERVEKLSGAEINYSNNL
ncbi:MAG TPA: germination protein YpeB [Candidatus Dormibacteraeota bacterium]|nr:germination protein YpeB [Candidatus Dormibacteraeota bacterium]